MANKCYTVKKTIFLTCFRPTPGPRNRTLILKMKEWFSWGIQKKEINKTKQNKQQQQNHKTITKTKPKHISRRGMRSRQDIVRKNEMFLQEAGRTKWQRGVPPAATYELLSHKVWKCKHFFSYSYFNRQLSLLYWVDQDCPCMAMESLSWIRW